MYLLILIFHFASSNIAIYGNCENSLKYHQKISDTCTSLTDTIALYRIRNEAVVVSLWRNAKSSEDILVLTQKLVNEMFKKLWSVQILEQSIKPMGDRITNSKPTFYVVLADDVSALSEIINSMINNAFNYDSQIITYLRKNVKPDQVLLVICPNRCMVYNFVIIIPSGKDCNELNIYLPRYYFRKKRTCHHVPRLILNNIWINGHNKKLRSRKDFHSPNLNECYIEVIAVKRPPYVTSETDGICNEILLKIGEHLDINFKIQLYEAESGNNSISLEEHIQNNRFVIGDTPLGKNASDHFILSDPYFNEKIVWVVPKAPVIPKYQILFSTFPSEVWILLIIIMFVVAALISLINKLTPESSDNFKGINSFVTVVSIIHFVSVSPQPKRFLIRCVFIAMVFFCLIIETAFQGELLSSLTNPVHRRQISTVKQILNSDLKIGIPEKYKKFIGENVDGKLVTYGDDYTEYDWLLQAAHFKNICSISKEFYVKYLMVTKPEFQDKFEETSSHFWIPKLYVIEKSVVMHAFQIALPKNYFLRKHIDERIGTFVEGGFIIKWTRDVTFQMKAMEARNEANSNEGEKLIVLKLNHVEAPFAEFGMFLCLSIILFCIEVGYYKVSMKMKVDKRGRKREN